MTIDITTGGNVGGGPSTVSPTRYKSAPQYLPNLPGSHVFYRDDGLSFVLEPNPTSVTTTNPLVQTNRPSLDGIVTYVWARDLQKVIIDGVSWKDLFQWVQFKENFQDQVVHYGNLMSGETKTFLVTSVEMRLTGQTPFNVMYHIELQESADITGQGAYPQNATSGPVS